MIVIELNNRSTIRPNIGTTMSTCQPFDAHCCHMGTAIKHPVPDRVKSSFVIFDIWSLIWQQWASKVKMNIYCWS